MAVMPLLPTVSPLLPTVPSSNTPPPPSPLNRTPPVPALPALSVHGLAPPPAPPANLRACSPSVHESNVPNCAAGGIAAGDAARTPATTDQRAERANWGGRGEEEAAGEMRPLAGSWGRGGLVNSQGGGSLSSSGGDVLHDVRRGEP